MASSTTSGHVHDPGPEWADVDGRVWRTCSWCNLDLPVSYVRPQRPHGNLSALSDGRMREDPITGKAFVTGRDPGDEDRSA